MFRCFGITKIRTFASAARGMMAMRNTYLHQAIRTFGLLVGMLAIAAFFVLVHTLAGWKDGRWLRYLGMIGAAFGLVIYFGWLSWRAWSCADRIALDHVIAILGILLPFLIMALMFGGSPEMLGPMQYAYGLWCLHLALFWLMRCGVQRLALNCGPRMAPAACAPLAGSLAGFWDRYFALSVDMFLGILFYQAVNQITPLNGGPVIIAVLFLYNGATFTYPVYFHARWGQTIGKMLAGVKVCGVYGGDIGFRKALIRSSVDGLLTVVGLVTAVIALNSPGIETTASGLSIANLSDLHRKQPAWIGNLVWIWLWSEIAVMLTNRRRRAIHDFIAGTLVVRDPMGPAFEIDRRFR